MLLVAAARRLGCRNLRGGVPWVPRVCRLNSCASSTFWTNDTSLALRNELHCNARPRICSEPCKHLVLLATFQECRVERATQALYATPRTRAKHFHRLSFIFAAHALSRPSQQSRISNVITINARARTHARFKIDRAHEYFPLFSSFNAHT